MKILIIWTLLLFSHQLFAQTFSQLTEEGKEEFVAMKKKGNHLIDEKCFQDQKHCLGLKALGKAPSSKRMPAELVGHPAGQHCSDIGGEVVILKDGEQNQWNFCKFQDGSLIESWSLYKSVARPKGKK